MALPQDISPLNPGLLDTLVQAKDGDWIQTDEDGDAFIKVLWTGAETGKWAALFRWKKGFAAAPHKHLSAAHTFVLSGRLQIRDGTLEAGDYIYERNGMIHEQTKALEDTEYLFFCDGPILAFDEEGFQGYSGWEEFRRRNAEYERSK